MSKKYQQIVDRGQRSQQNGDLRPSGMNTTEKCTHLPGRHLGRRTLTGSAVEGVDKAPGWK